MIVLSYSTAYNVPRPVTATCQMSLAGETAARAAQGGVGFAARRMPVPGGRPPDERDVQLFHAQLRWSSTLGRVCKYYSLSLAGCFASGAFLL